MNWKKPILTDSGGYQIMSLSKLNKIDKKLELFSSLILTEKNYFKSRKKYSSSKNY